LDIAQRGRLAVKLGRAAAQTLQASDVADVLSAVLAEDPPTEVRGELRLPLAIMLHRRGEDVRRQRRLFAGAGSELGGRAPAAAGGAGGGNLGGGLADGPGPADDGAPEVGGPGAGGGQASGRPTSGGLGAGQRQRGSGLRG